MMENHFVTYNQSLALKELGFDEPCLKLWEKTILFTSLVDPSEFKKVVSERYTKAPLKSQVFEWFRKEHELESYIEKGWSQVLSMYEYRFHFRKSEEIGLWGQTSYWANVGDFKTYEEAESACIDKLIELIKKKYEIHT